MRLLFASREPLDSGQLVLDRFRDMLGSHPESFSTYKILIGADDNHMDSLTVGEKGLPVSLS